MKQAILYLEYLLGPEWGLGIMTGESDQVLFNNMRVSGPNKGWRQGGKKNKNKKPTQLILSKARWRPGNNQYDNKGEEIFQRSKIHKIQNYSVNDLVQLLRDYMSFCLLV